MTEQEPEKAARPLKERRENVIVLSAIAVVVVAALIWGALDGDDEPERTTFPAPPAQVTVVYEVDGTVPYASVTLKTPDGIEQIEPDVPLVTQAGDTGLTYTFPAGDFVSVSAQKTAGQGRGEITCRISVDGVVIAENTSTAQFGVASCDGSARVG